MQRWIATMAAAVAAASLPAQGYESSFEALNASATGVPLNGQDGYYNPVAGSVDWNVYNYAGNSYSIPQNLLGGAKFVLGQSAGGTAYARSQRAVTFGGTTWQFSVDICGGTYAGVLPASQYLGSISLQPSATNAHFNMLLPWDDVNTAQTFSCNLQYFDTANTLLTGIIPDPAFQLLPLNQWYRWTVAWDFSTNQIIETTIMNLTTFVSTTWVPPSPWYLRGGLVPAPICTDIRLFAGGTVAGNVLAVDNCSVTDWGSFTPFGIGCGGPAGAPILRAAPGSRPTLGGSFTLDLTNLPAAPGFAFFVVGFSNTSFPPFTLPLDMAVFGAPGCTLYCDPGTILSMPHPGGSVSWSLTLPSAPSLMGFDAYAQAGASAPGFNALGAMISNAGHAVLGR